LRKREVLGLERPLGRSPHLVVIPLQEDKLSEGITSEREEKKQDSRYRKKIPLTRKTWDADSEGPTELESGGAGKTNLWGRQESQRNEMNVGGRPTVVEEEI